MAVEYKYYKNSNTGEIIFSQYFDIGIKNIPTYWYDFYSSPIGENINIPDGFIEISEKKYQRMKRKLRRQL